MGMIISFVSGTLGRILIGGGLILATWFSIKLYYESKGAAKEVARIVEAGHVNTRKATKARAKAKVIPDDKLWDHYFRD